MMLNLKMRDEFLGSQMPGTAIALRRKDNTGTAQETRDLIRILASYCRERGERVPIITPAYFFVDDDTCGVQSLLNSIQEAAPGTTNQLKEWCAVPSGSGHAVLVLDPCPCARCPGSWAASPICVTGA